LRLICISKKNGVYTFEPHKLKEAHIWCQTKTREALRRGWDVVVSNTFTQMWELAPYIETAYRLGVTVEIIVVHGNYTNVHNVPADVIARMRERWED
jgi:hypothetical protein